MLKKHTLLVIKVMIYNINKTMYFLESIIVQNSGNTLKNVGMHTYIF